MYTKTREQKPTGQQSNAVANNNTSSLKKASSQPAVSPVQRLIVRAGYDAAKSNSWNKFVKSPHFAVKKKVELLEAANAADRIDDYRGGALVNAKAGIIGTTLHVVGHGKPGEIAGISASTMADNIKTSLGTDAAAITSVKLHSCFSNIDAGDGTTSGSSFSGVFKAVPVVAASGIHYADTATNLPARYTGFKFAASIAKKALVVSKPWLKDDGAGNKTTNEAKIDKTFALLAKSGNGLEGFFKTDFVKYKGLDTAGGKTVENKGVADYWNKLGVNIDSMPPTTYPDKIESIQDGLIQSYTVAFSDIEKAKAATKVEAKKEKLDELVVKLDEGYNKSAEGYTELKEYVKTL